MKQYLNKSKNLKSPFKKWKFTGGILGQGANSTVYEAYSKDGLFGNKKYVAIKVVRVRADNITSNAFVEIQILRNLQKCKNIVKYYEHTICDVRDTYNKIIGNDIFICMEKLTCLTDVKKFWNETNIIKLSLDILNALKEAHNIGILHRDIKPQNIFMSENGIYKLGDFGLAKITSNDSCKTKGIGSQAYVSPEQNNINESGTYDCRSDLYSLGLVIYQKLNDGRLPFVTKDNVSNEEMQIAVINRLSGKQLPLPKNGSKKFQNIIMKACSFKKEDRYRNVEEMIKDIESLNDKEVDDIPTKKDKFDIYKTVSANENVINKVQKDIYKTVSADEDIINKVQKDICKTVSADGNIINKVHKDIHKTIFADNNVSECNNLLDKNLIKHEEINISNYNKEDFEIIQENENYILKKYNGNSENVNIPLGVTTIETFAFKKCEYIKNVIIPNTVVYIEKAAFCFGVSLTNIFVDNDNKNYFSEDGILYNKNKKELLCYPSGRIETTFIIPNTVKKIGIYAFSYCVNLSSIHISKKVTLIEHNAFHCCLNLTSVLVDNSNNTYMSENGILYNKEKTELIYYPYGKQDTTFIVPNTVVSINDSAFCLNSNLTSINLPDSLTTIGNNAFRSCSNLTDVVIPNNVVEIGSYAFSDCPCIENIKISQNVLCIGRCAFSDMESLRYIVVHEDNEEYLSYDGVLYNKEKTELICYLLGKKETKFTIPSGITSIKDGAFENCDSLVSIVIPCSLISISNFSFQYCKNLKYIYYEGSESDWEKISIGWFNEPLINASIYYNYNGYSANQDSNNYDKTNEKHSKNFIINEYDSRFKFDVSDCKATITRVDTAISGDIIIPSKLGGYDVTVIGDFAFRGCEHITSVVIPNTVTSIGKSAFKFCKNLISIDIPNSVTTIGDELFYGCKNLKSVDIPNSITMVPKYTFSGCNNLMKIDIPNSVTSILDSAFNCCTSLSNIIIPKSVTYIGEYVFYNCKNLTSIIISDNITNIGNYAFYDCPKLTDVYYQGSKEKFQFIIKSFSNNKINIYYKE